MGVRGLLKYLRLHPKSLRRVSLRDLARAKTNGKRGSVKLLCDFFAILYWLLSEFHQAKVKKGDYHTYSYLYGGDFIEYGQRFVSFVKALRYIGIEVIFYVDGDRGSNLQGFHAKLETYKRRHQEEMETIRKCYRVAQYDPKQEVEGYKTWFPHPLLKLHIEMVLKSEGVALEYCIGEADAYLARRAQQDPNVCGILTNDTDMVMMLECNVFLCHFFDRKAILGIGCTEFNERPIDIICELATAQSLASTLNLDQRDLKSLSVICGNDYTGQLNSDTELHKTLELRYPFVESAATWLRGTPHDPDALHKTPPFNQPSYHEAIKFTYQAYGEMSGAVTATGSDSGDPPDSPSYSIILEEVKAGRMTRELLPVVAHSIHWRRGIMERMDDDLPAGQLPLPCIGDLLVPIRKLMYRLLDLSMVEEYGRTKGCLYKCIPVPVPPSRIALPALREKSLLERALLTATFVVKAEALQTSDLNQFCRPLPQKYSQCSAPQTIRVLIKPLVLCASVLFSCQLKSSESCSLDVLLATCFMCCLGKSPQKVLSRPHPDAIYIAARFALILKHVYHLASLLGLLEFMPLPAEMFQIAALVPFYHTAIHKPANHQLRLNPNLARTHTIFQFITSRPKSAFAKFKGMLEESHCTSSSDDGLIPPATSLRLAQAFIEVIAELDEADKDHLLEPVLPVAKHPSKGKSNPKRRATAKASSSEYRSPFRVDVDLLAEELASEASNS